MRSKNRNPWVLLLLLLVGLVIGGIIGDLFKGTFEILGYGKSIGFDPFLVDLSVFKFTLGFMMNINLSSIIGLVISIFIFNKI